MVFICPLTEDPKDFPNEIKEKYPYPLHNFQLWAIDGLLKDKHVLITAPTGSGKSMPAEFAIHFFCEQRNKKVVYCSPIKALSNQKFHDFSLKFPNISVGLITGDIKTNPNADVLIMTTEILLNHLLRKNDSIKANTSTSFDLDLDIELSCVIFDEIHMINDASRGHVWELCILNMPPHVQMVGLSATLDKPEQFASWLQNSSKTKEVYLAKKLDRAVPLIHYSFVSATQLKTLKDKATEDEIRQIIKRPLIIQNEKNEFQLDNYLKVTRVLDVLQRKDIRIKRPLVLNELLEHLKQNEMLPAICYVFSRKQLEQCALEVTTQVLEFDSKVSYTIEKECEQMLRQKLPNFQEYLHLPEYVNMVALLRKGIAIHHSGLAPILREMVEIFFERGSIKVLFATESVAIGLNLPVKTCIFTDIFKHDGSNFRLLEAHEYTQAAGRAGRLGLDTVGHVILLNNLFRTVETVNLKKMMNNQPQTLLSKFKFSVHLFLQILQKEEEQEPILNQSLLHQQINASTESLKRALIDMEAELTDFLSILGSKREKMNEVCLLQNKIKVLKNAPKKEMERKLDELLKSENQDFRRNLELMPKLFTLENEIREKKDQLFHQENYMASSFRLLRHLLESEQCITESNVLTLKGQIASMLKECHSLVFADLLTNNIETVNKLDALELATLFSCFTSVTVPEDFVDLNPCCQSDDVNELSLQVKSMMEKYEGTIELKLKTGFDYTFHFDLMQTTLDWCIASTEDECKLVLQNMSYDKGIFLGEFIKSMLKVNNIAAEMEPAAELLNNLSLLKKLREIPGLTLKYIVTSQSLYL